jgi:hypothetical protein
MGACLHTQIKKKNGINSSVVGRPRAGKPFYSVFEPSSK